MHAPCLLQLAYQIELACVCVCVCVCSLSTQLGSQGSNAALLASATHRTAGGSASRVDHRPVAGAGPSDTPAMPLPQRVNEEEAAHWKRTDNIIMTVLSG